MKFSFKIFMIAQVVLLINLSWICGAAAQSNKAGFVALLKFSRGAGEGQLFWNSTRAGGVLDGPFQGPMAFLTDKNGNFWIGDTLNGRIIAVDRQKKQHREIDLLAVAKELELASAPVLLDMVPGKAGTLLVADAQNNAIIELDIKTKQAKIFKAAQPGQKGFWRQINRIHADKNGRIYVEDLPAMRTQVLYADGKPAYALEGEVGIAVDAAGKAAMIVMDTSNPRIRHLVKSPVPGAPAEMLASFEARRPIVWAAVIGFSADNNVYAVFDTESQRYYAAFNNAGKKVFQATCDFPDPGYDPARPDWISPAGDIFTVLLASDSLQILKLEQ
jgi:sugar lactone lactonase YvrE